MIKNTSNQFQNLKFIDLFCGIGAFHKALSSFGAECVFACEIDKYSQITYKTNYGINPYGDIKKINENAIPNHDILCAGFPCQPFSISGKQEGLRDNRGTLFFDVVRIVKAKQPKILLLENVDNLKKHDNGNTYDIIIKNLKSAGYFCFDEVIDSAHFGIAQKRKRIYFVCIRKDILINDNFHFPKSIHKKSYVNNILERPEKVKKYIINRDDIFFKTSTNNEQTSLNLEEKINFEPIRIGIIGKGGQGERIYSIDAPSITLSANGGGIAAKTGAYKVENIIRKLSPRECARLMGFDDDFKIVVSDSQAIKQFGNSIVVDVLQYIVNELIEQGYNYEYLGR